MVGLDLVVPELLQELQTPEAEDNFLRQAILLVAAVEAVGELAIPIGIVRQVGVEQVDRDGVTVNALHVILPGADPDLALLNFDADAAFDLF